MKNIRIANGLLVEYDKLNLRTLMFDNYIDHRNMAYQDRDVYNLNEQINPLNYDDFVDKFDNEIH
jgi:hypothetical protein